MSDKSIVRSMKEITVVNSHPVDKEYYIDKNGRVIEGTSIYCVYYDIEREVLLSTFSTLAQALQYAEKFKGEI